MKKIFSLLSKKNHVDDIISKNISYLFNQAYYYTGSKEDAEDLIQDLLTKLLKNKNSIPTTEKIKPWLLRCLYHQFVDNYRSSKRVIVIDDTDPDYYVDSAKSDGNAEDGKLYQEVMSALNQLPKKQRAIIFLHDINGHSLPDLAKTLQIPLGTLKSSLHRGRSTLKEKLDMEPFPRNERYSDKGDT